MRPLILASVAVLAAPAFAAPEHCAIATVAELPVTMVGKQPMVPVTIDGTKVMMMADSGAFATVITASAAAALKLPIKLPNRGYETDMTLEGVGGHAKAHLAIAKTFALGAAVARNVQLVVGGSEISGAGVVGRPILMFADTDYDLAAGIIRIVKPLNCGSNALAYWAGEKPVSVIDIGVDAAAKGIFGTVYVNGLAMRASFDTGSTSTILSLAAAARAGLVPGDAGVVAEDGVHGLGPRVGRTWVSPVASIKIGGEEVRRTRMRFGEVSGLGIDMFIGADWFLSHHAYVAAGQHKLYFTYNGGPVFDIDGKRAAASNARAVARAANAPAPIRSGR